ncbi:hypothetical protein [Phyllobacterium sp. SB3]|uniref:hypothetical protein n=1 Tax=Phyllobacterium sp. SB3 TaxID=3156073 RepID=UPI0032AE9F7A
MSVVRRLVILLPGFEHMPVEAHYRRFVREAGKTAPVYDMAPTEPSSLHVDTVDNGISVGRFSLDTKGDDWSAHTDFALYGLGDITLFYASRNPATRLLSGLFALLDFIISGTFFRFIITSWRYALFFIYPLLVIAGIIVASASAGYLIDDVFPHSPFVLPGAGLLAAVCLFWFSASKLHLLLLMDDWTFARDMARGKRPEVVRKMENVVTHAAALISEAPADTEIIVAAHSLGAICALPIIDEALKRNKSRRYGLLTVGSSLLKVALHPSAAHLRDSVANVAQSNTTWIDAQSLTDPMNFYKSDPIRDLDIAKGRSPVLMQVRFRHQLCEESYKAIRRDFFRVHRQFVFGVDKRTRYSWHAILCGPQRFADIAARGGLPCEKVLCPEDGLKIVRPAIP